MKAFRSPVSADELEPGMMILNPDGSTQTVATVEHYPKTSRYTLHEVTFKENEPEAAPALYSSRDWFNLRRTV